MSTRRMGRNGQLADPGEIRRRDAELAERIAEQAAEGPRGPHTRADENRRAAFARQRPVDGPEDAAEPPAPAGEGQGRGRTIVQLSATRRTRVRRGGTGQG